MTTEQEFDLVAPIAIYHYADVCYRRQAQAAIRKAKKLLNQDWSPYLKYTDPDGLTEIGDRYKNLFREIVIGQRPEWVEFVDKWGAYGFKDEQGNVVFSGDDMYRFPWYETAGSLIERIYEA